MMRALAYVDELDAQIQCDDAPDGNDGSIDAVRYAVMGKS